MTDSFSRDIRLNYVGVDRASSVAAKIERRNISLASVSSNAFNKMRAVATQAAAMALKAGAAIAASIAAAGVAANKSSNKLGEIEKRARAFGLSVTQFQQMAYAADDFSTSVDAVAVGYRTLTRHLSRGSQMSAEAVDGFKALGIGLDEVIGKGADEVFLRVADAVKDAKNPTVALGASMGVLGDSAEDMMFMLSQGGDAIRASMGDAERLLRPVTPEDLQKATAMRKAVLDVKTTFGNIWESIGLKIMPMMTSIANWMAEKARVALDYWNAIGSVSKDLQGVLWETVTETLKDIGKGIKWAFDIWVRGIDSMLTTIMQTIDYIASGIGEMFRVFGDVTGSDTLKSAGASMQNLELEQAYTSAKNSAKDFWSDVEDYVMSARVEIEKAKAFAKATAGYEVTERGLKGVSYFDNYPSGAAALGGSRGTFQYDTRAFGASESPVVREQKATRAVAERAVKVAEETRDEIKRQRTTPPDWMPEIEGDQPLNLGGSIWQM